MKNADILELPRPLSARLGKFWFKYRSFSPVPLFLAMLFMSPELKWTWLGYWVLIICIIFAEGLRICSVSFAGSVTRTRGNSVPRLVHAGPYRHVRNPLYIANIILYTSCSLLFGFLGLSLAVFVFSILEYIFIVSYEEELLKDTFGAKYLAYCQAVSQWLPSFKAQYPSSEHTFDLRQGLRSEKSTFYAIFGMVILFLIKQSTIQN